jgi:integration host factor subunit beta
MEQPLRCCRKDENGRLTTLTRSVPLIRSELLKALEREYPDLSAGQVEQGLDAFFDAIAGSLALGNRVELRGFGTFSARQRKSRTGRNPTTGAKVDVSEKQVPHFKPAQGMNERINLSDEQIPRGDGLAPDQIGCHSGRVSAFVHWQRRGIREP